MRGHATSHVFKILMPTVRTYFAPLVLVAVVGCSADALAPTPPPTVPCDADVCDIRGRVEWAELEGGFWVILGDDEVAYDPLNNLPADFRRHGLRVRALVRIRSDLGSFHMVGPIVEVLSIRRE